MKPYLIEIESSCCLNKYGISLTFGFSFDSLNLWLVDTERVNAHVRGGPSMTRGGPILVERMVQGDHSLRGTIHFVTVHSCSKPDNNMTIPELYSDRKFFNIATM